MYGLPLVAVCVWCVVEYICVFVWCVYVCSCVYVFEFVCVLKLVIS